MLPAFEADLEPGEHAFDQEDVEPKLTVSEGMDFSENSENNPPSARSPDTPGFRNSPHTSVNKVDLPLAVSVAAEARANTMS